MTSAVAGRTRPAGAQATVASRLDGLAARSGGTGLARIAEGARSWKRVMGDRIGSAEGSWAGADWSAPGPWRRLRCDAAEAAAAAGLAAGLAPPERAALGVLARRGHDAFEALDTVPLADLFSAREQAEIEALAHDLSPVPAGEPSWLPGKPFGYDGVVAAILKVTRLCNMRCTYCLDWREGPGQTMPLAVQAACLASLLGGAAHRDVQIVWHGGEPTVIGRRAFLRLLRLQRWFMRPGQRIGNRVQTNATTATRAWTDLWSLLGIRVSASIDGDRESHDRQRPMAGGRPSHALVRRGLDRLAGAGVLEHVYWVVGPQTVAEGAEAVWSRIQALRPPEIGLLPMRTPEAPSGPVRSFAEFLLALRTARRAAPDPWVPIREIDSAERAVARRMPAFCELMGNCLGHVFSVDPDGTIRHCDRFVGSEEHVLGNVLDGGFAAARAGPALARLRDAEAARLDRFSSCPQFAHCQGWCPHVTRAGHAWIAGTDAGCCGLRPLLDGIERDP